MKIFRLIALLLISPLVQAAPAQAVLGGGCFWCIEADFEKLPGVLDVVSGYSGGKESEPTYEQVATYKTGHIEVVRVTYDPAKLSYAALLDWYWRHIDPLTPGGQFCDRGPQYRSAIFYGSPAEKAAAETSRDTLQKALGQKFATELIPAATFWPAEEYHQDYYKKNPLRYTYYRRGCGRDARVQEIWGKLPEKR